MTDGLIGCDAARCRPIPKLIAVLAGKDEAVRRDWFPTPFNSVTEVSAEVGVLVLFRRWCIVPPAIELLISNCCCPPGSVLDFKCVATELPLGRGVGKGGE